MKIQNLMIAALFFGISFVGCDKVDDAKKLMQQINELTAIKQQLEKKNRDLSEKLSRADEKIDQLHQKNKNLKSDLTKLKDKHKKNIERLFQ